ncbi:MAG: ADP-ribosylglycohydrolase family protein [Sulfuritalea sp.]|nr:ADP-ribosylglycohydrolase family protein [Sulfuritalea sp.]
MEMQQSDQAANHRHIPDADIRDHFQGCLLGGAVGDALGAPVEFMSRDKIIAQFGDGGIRDMVPAYGLIGAITDDTQMALFTAEGLLRAWVRQSSRGICHPPSVIANAYLRWLHTQGIDHPLHRHCLNGWLIQQKELFAQRAPGNTCLLALQEMRSSSDRAKNQSKGCGGVMRVAPVGMMMAGQTLSDPTRKSFSLACEVAAITHGHPTGQLAAGAFAAIIHQLLTGISLVESIDKALHLLNGKPGHAETSGAIRQAIKFAADNPNSTDALQTIGKGWVAEEALAIGLYCALCATDIEAGVILAVNHDGDSDSTGLIAGHLLGAIHGASGIPQRWLGPLELRTVLEDVADDLATVSRWKLDDDAGDEGEYYFDRYPGG